MFSSTTSFLFGQSWWFSCPENNRCEQHWRLVANSRCSACSYKCCSTDARTRHSLRLKSFAWPNLAQCRCMYLLKRISLSTQGGEWLAVNFKVVGTDWIGVELWVLVSFCLIGFGTSRIRDSCLCFVLCFILCFFLCFSRFKFCLGDSNVKMSKSSSMFGKRNFSKMKDRNESEPRVRPVFM